MITGKRLAFTLCLATQLLLTPFVAMAAGGAAKPSPSARCANQACAAGRLDDRNLRQGGSEGRGDLDAGVRSQGMARGRRSHNRGGGAGQGQQAARSLLRDEPAAASRRQLSHRREFFPHPHADRQPVRGLLVVPQGVRRARLLQRGDRLAEFQGHQLPGQHLAEREADRQLGRRCRGVAHLRIQRYRCGETGRRKCSGRRGVGAYRTRPCHHLRRLESGSSRQKHGVVARSVSHHQRTSVVALSHRRVEAEFPRQRSRCAHRHRAGKERNKSADQGQAQRPDRGRQVRTGGGARAQPGVRRHFHAG